MAVLADGWEATRARWGAPWTDLGYFIIFCWASMSATIFWNMAMSSL
jgi:hypothetical protein